MLAPQIPNEIQQFREEALRYLREHVHPLEQRIAETGVLDFDEYEDLRLRARKELPLPDGYERTADESGPEVPMLVHVAIEEIAGHATNGLGGVVPRAGGRDVFDKLASPSQRERYVLPVMRGEMRAAWAITEPNSAGSDVTGIEATAVRDGDEWLLNGEKWFVTGGDRAAIFLVLVWAEGEQALFVVDRTAPGLEIVRRPQFMHDPYTSGHVELTLDNCRVPGRQPRPSGRRRDSPLARRRASDDRRPMLRRRPAADRRDDRVVDRADRVRTPHRRQPGCSNSRSPIRRPSFSQPA